MRGGGEGAGSVQRWGALPFNGLPPHHSSDKKNKLKLIEVLIIR